MPSDTLDRFRRLSWKDRALLTEASFWLFMSSTAIALMPFRYVAQFASSRVQSRTNSDLAAEVARIRWAIRASARRVPFTAVCFQQALAAHIMLRLRGISTVIHYGAAQDEDGTLAAHVWVRANGLDVIGCEDASRFALLATFPPSESPRPDAADS